MISDKHPPTALNLPGWGMDRGLYDRLCRYLGFTPAPALHDPVARYLLRVAATQPAPTGFARWLAELRPGPMALAFLDVWTRLLMPAHPWRFRLNAIIAMHECDPDGYRELMTHGRSRFQAWTIIARSAFSFGLNLVFGLPWLAFQGSRYILARNRTRREREYFAGTTVLVTGASRGLGLAMVARLLSLGASVVAIARASAALEALRAQATESGWGERLRVAAADVADPGALRDALDACGIEVARIDIAIINAGIKGQPGDLDISVHTPHPSPPPQGGRESCRTANRLAPPPLAGGGWGEGGERPPDIESSIRRIFDVNLFGALHSIVPLLTEWRSRGRGHFIVISSLGRWHGMVGTGAYNASKAALSILAESMAMDLAAAHCPAIAMTIIEPGLIRTDMTANGALQNLLSVDTETAAIRILQGAATGQRICRFPFLFTAMTFIIALLPLGLRIRLFARMRPATEFAQSPHSTS